MVPRASKRSRMPHRPLRVADAALIAGAVAVAVALPALANGFAFDDVWIVQRHPVVGAPGSLMRLITATYWPPTDGEGALWRPIALAALAAQWALGGGAPFVFHAVTVALAGVAAGLMAAFTGALFGPLTGLLAGLLFAVHPIHVEVTATVVGQAELLAAIAYLLALGVSWRVSRSTPDPKRGWWIAAAAAAVLLGAGCKEHVITLPAALPVIWWWRARQDGRRVGAVAREQLPVFLATLGASLAFVLLRWIVLRDFTNTGGVATGLDPSSAVRRAVVMLPLSLRWLELLFVPIRLSAVYSPQHVIANPAFGVVHAAALLVWTGGAALVWHVRHRLPAVAVGAWLFTVTIALVSNVLVPLEVLLAERLLFLPSVGWAMAVAGGLTALLTETRHGRAARIAVAVVLLAFAGRSVVRAPVWKSNAVLFAQMLRDAPDSFQTHWALGAEALAVGDSGTTEREWREAIRLNPDHPQPLEDLGRLYARSGRWAPAVPLLDRAVQLDSARLGTALLLASAMSHTGRHAEALRVLDVMERRHVRGPATAAMRADVLRRAGDLAGALVAARDGLVRDSTNWRLWALATELAVMAADCEAAANLGAGTRRHAAAAGAAATAEEVLDGMANRNASCK